MRTGTLPAMIRGGGGEGAAAFDGPCASRRRALPCSCPFPPSACPVLYYFPYPVPAGRGVCTCTLGQTYKPAEDGD